MGCDIGDLVNEALSEGFSSAGPLNMEALSFMPEVRAMCNADSCKMYGKNWKCPPACGSIEEAARQAAKYSFGLLVQTVGALDDEFDYESMQEIGQRHKHHFERLISKLRKRWAKLLPMGAGACTICKECAYPDAPCRFPGRAVSSMEAYGLWVSKVCELSALPYNYGKLTLAYTSCCLLE